MSQVAREAPRYLIQSAATTLEVLLVFGHPPGHFSPSEIAARLDIDRNQAFRCLRTLQHVGFVGLGDDERFVLTPLAAHLASSARPTSLSSAAQAALDDLSLCTGETINLFAKEGEAVILIDHRDGLRPVRLVTEVGRMPFPLHAGACPKAVLAFLSATEQAAVLARLPEYPRYTPDTATDPDVLRNELEQIRARGYAISGGDVDVDACGVGAPIYGAAGQVAGAVSVGGPASRMTSARLDELGQLIVATAHLISRQLGYNGSSPVP
ncbi:IclR family transcriptional regulator [Deinococcus alpinitundrae]|uniref:IclR family transcriptional regulator n=1 Tax=Deinococcus alpinitundrae TaxID=468913 RepID=UPI00137A11C7|nr:IclR family transcriptional regulator [Deinococcus alpinitundrae]